MNAPLARKVLTCVSALSAAATPAADVLVVDGLGAGTFPNVAAAVAAAAPGDTILIRAGNYGSFTIDGLGLTVTADEGAVVVIQDHVTVQNLGPSDAVVLRGLAGSSFKPLGLTVRTCEGGVLVEDCVLRGTGTPSPFFPGGFEGAGVCDAAGVSFVRCSITGATTSPKFSSHGGPGLLVEGGSAVHLYDSAVSGGPGSPNFVTLAASSGGPGARVSEASFLFASGSEIRGGAGSVSLPFGGSCIDGGDGGDALVVQDAASSVRLLDTLLAAGPGEPAAGAGCAGGTGGASSTAPAGAVQTLPGTARTLAASHPVREGATITFTYAGEPGDAALLLLSSAHDPAFLAPLFGTLLPAAASLSAVPLGTLPASGSAQLAAPVAPIQGQDALLFVQLAVLTAGLEPRLGSGQSVVLLDAGF